MRKHNRIALIALTLAIAVGLGSVGTAFTAIQKDPASATLAFEQLKALVGHWQATTNNGKDPANATPAFEKLKTLAGRWEATTDKGKASTTYELVSGGESCWSARTSPERRK